MLFPHPIVIPELVEQYEYTGFITHNQIL